MEGHSVNSHHKQISGPRYPPATNKKERSTSCDRWRYGGFSWELWGIVLRKCVKVITNQFILNTVVSLWIQKKSEIRFQSLLRQDSFAFELNLNSADHLDSIVYSCQAHILEIFSLWQLRLRPTISTQQVQCTKVWVIISQDYKPIISYQRNATAVACRQIKHKSWAEQVFMQRRFDKNTEQRIIVLRWSGVIFELMLW